MGNLDRSCVPRLRLGKILSLTTLKGNKSHFGADTKVRHDVEDEVLENYLRGKIGIFALLRLQFLSRHRVQSHYIAKGDLVHP